MTGKSLLIIFQLMLMLPVAFSAGGMTIADSLMADTTFVLRGELSGSWQGRELKFAVTDPLRNRTHELKSAPSLVMTDAGGKRVMLDDFKGKYVCLDFWDFGCKPCVREFGVMPLFKQHFADVLDRVELVTVCGSHPDSRTFSNFVRKHGMDGINLMIDARQSDKCYQPGFYPFYVLIDPQGRIVEFNTARPSQMLRESRDGGKSIFGKALYGDAAATD